MIDLLVDTSIIPLILLGLFSLCFLIQMVWLWFFFWRLARKKPAETPANPVPVSVVICAHNKYSNLKENLPLILEQEYPDFEVLVVDHASDDDTRYLCSYYSEKYPNFKFLTVSEDLNFFTGKKFPLSIGIKSARYDWILLTDADCRPAGKEWIRSMMNVTRPETGIVLGYSPFIKGKGLLNKLIRFDNAVNALHYLSFALAGIPYMGIGRNLSYRKQLFYENNGFIAHYRVRSGDDDLFINQVATSANTSVTVDPDGFVYAPAQESFISWMRMKQRYASTARLYKFSHKLLLRLFSFSSFGIVALFILMLSLNWSAIPVLVLFSIRLICQIVVFSGGLKRLRDQDLAPLVPLFELIMFFVKTWIFIPVIFRTPQRWK